MPRAPKDLFGLLTHIGLTHIRERGDEVWASCPNHKDSGDSWSINRVSGLHSCFGCGYAGTLLTLVMDVLDGDNFAAARLVRSYGVEDVLDYLETSGDLLRQRDEVVPENPFRPVHMSVGAVFQSFGYAPDDALAKRRISRESAAFFGLRWKAPKTWVLPIQSPTGKLMGWEEKGPQFVHDRPRGVQTAQTVFGAPHLQICRRAILVESPLDAVLLHSMGIENAFASFGAVVSDAQMSLLREYADETVLALDNDKAGRENSARLIQGLRYSQKGQAVRSVEWVSRSHLKVINYAPSDGKDVGEMSEERIREALDTSMDALLWAQKVERLNHVPGHLAPLPGRSSHSHGRGQKGFGSARSWPRQNPVLNRRRREAH